MTSLIFALLFSLSAWLGPENIDNPTDNNTQYTQTTPGPGDGGDGGGDDPILPPTGG